MELLIVRHGECQGQINPDFYADRDSPLTGLGEKQAQLTAQRLQYIGITQIVSSPLKRALATASIISENIGNLAVHVWPEICEMHSYNYHGLHPTEIILQFPLAVLPVEANSEAWNYGNLTYAGVFERCKMVLLSLIEQHQANDRVLMVTHGGFANYLLHAILNIPASQPTWFTIENCAISKVRFVPNPELERNNSPLYPPVQVELLGVNDTSHLGTLKDS